jgi:cytochrome P450
MIMLEAVAAVIGLDEVANPERLARLESCMYPLSEAAEIKWAERNRRDVISEGLQAKQTFASEFVHPAFQTRARRRENDAMPRDLLSLLAQNSTHREDAELAVREAIVYLSGATLTTSTAIVNTVLHLEEWFTEHPEDRQRATDEMFLLRAANEALRLEPTAPFSIRTALRETQLPSGRHVAGGEAVLLDRGTIHRDPTIFGHDAAQFNPNRKVPPRVAHYGLAFGGGRHSCIGRPLVTDGGAGQRTGAPRRAIPSILAALYEAGLQLDPTQPAVPAASAQPRFTSVPAVLLGSAA